ncbi:MAG: Gfo/Idh/MocA family oxidoreductase [Lachnospiraceae bacterium]|nr:Gfo/Idh/MocA family oxidoreductase [Lachnospiraceae bacterium]
MKTVITYGTFDLFHEGHYNILKRAKELGDYLIVGVTTEGYDMSRGKLNVVEPVMDRIEHVKQSGFADQIIIEDHVGQKIEDIQKYHVDTFVIGSDWLGKFDYLKEYCEVVYLERTKGVSSTLKRSEEYKLIRIGVVGSGRIAGRFVAEARYVSGIHVAGVFNPHMESARAFAKEYELDICEDDYDRFLREVDAVYVASPHGTHYAYALQALEQGKHALVEKPMVLKKAEAERLFSLAYAKKRVLMEAIKTAYAPGFIRMITMAKSGLIGEIRDVEACFTKLTGDNTREFLDTEYGGSFTELASYTLLSIFKIFGCDEQGVEFSSMFTEKGPDGYTKAYFTFKNGIATSKTGLKVKSEGALVISGTGGYIRVEAPWWKTKEFEICYEDTSKNEKVYSQFQGDGLRYEISDFVNAINHYGNTGYKLTQEESVKLAEMMERFLEYRKSKGS